VGSKTVKASPVTVTLAGKTAVITSFTAAPKSLSTSGGTVTLSAAVTNATKCAFSASPTVTGLPKTVTCTSGTASDSVTLPAASSPVTYTFTLTATGSTSNASATATVVDGEPTPAGTITQVLPIAGGTTPGKSTSFTD